MSDRGVCPSCGAPVESWAPVIHSDVVRPQDGGVSWLENDTVIGWDLHPCGHRCDHVEWTSASGHRFFNGPVR